MTLAYLYKWVHVPTNKWYIGSRTRKGCCPNDKYICSSKDVKDLILASPADWVRNILCIGDPIYIRTLEGLYLKVLNAKFDRSSFNKHNGDGKFSTVGVPPYNKGKPLPYDQRIKISQSRKGQPGHIPTDLTRTKIRESKIGSKNPMYGRDPWNKGITGLYKQTSESNQKRSAKLRGIPRSDEVKEKIRATKAALKLHVTLE